MDIGKGLESLIPQRPPQAGNESPPEEKKRIEIDPRGLRESESGNPKLIDQGTEPESPPENAKEEIDGIVFQIELEKIKPNPHQPRRHFNEESLRELSSSIREFGILQPLVVSKVEQESEWGWSVHYELIAGERRFLAAKMLGLQTVPAVIRQVPIEREKLELAVTENIQRDDLNPIELARAVAKLQDEFGLTQREIAVRLGKSREVVANSIRLLGLPTNMQKAIADGRMSASQARVLLSIEDDTEREQIFKDILEGGLSVREVKSRAQRSKGGAVSNNREAEATPEPELNALREQLQDFFGTKVELKSKGPGGKLTINYYSEEELNSIIDKLLKRHSDDVTF